MAVSRKMKMLIDAEGERTYLASRDHILYMRFYLCASSADEAVTGPFSMIQSNENIEENICPNHSTIIYIGTCIRDHEIDDLLKIIRPSVEKSLIQNDFRDEPIFSRFSEPKRVTLNNIRDHVEHVLHCIIEEEFNESFDPMWIIDEISAEELKIDETTTNGELETIAEPFCLQSDPPMHPYDVYKMLQKLRDSLIKD